MKALIFLLCVGLAILLAAPTFAGNCETASISAENSYTSSLVIPVGGMVVVNDTSSMSMTVTIQVQDQHLGWVDVETMTAEGGKAIVNGGNRPWRVGCKTGDYTSGTARVTICKNR